jgi:DNA-binding HxlR family transcriptional regulator
MNKTHHLTAQAWPANVYAQGCPSRLVLSRIGEKWSMLAIVALEDGPKRFGVLKRELEGVSQKMLTEKLRGMERDGLVLRRAYMEMPLRVEYELTQLGQSLVPILKTVRQWVQVHAPFISETQARYDEEQEAG